VQSIKIKKLRIVASYEGSLLHPSFPPCLFFRAQERRETLGSWGSPSRRNASCVRGKILVSTNCPSALQHKTLNCSAGTSQTIERSRPKTGLNQCAAEDGSLDQIAAANWGERKRSLVRQRASRVTQRKFRESLPLVYSFLGNRRRFRCMHRSFGIIPDSGRTAVWNNKTHASSLCSAKVGFKIGFN
jgi:hypothetical protein